MELRKKFVFFFSLAFKRESKIFHNNGFYCLFIFYIFGDCADKFAVSPMINETASSPALLTIIPGAPFGVNCKVEAIPQAEVSFNF